MADTKKQNKIFLVGLVLIVLVVAWSFLRPLVSKIGGNKNSEEEINKEIIKASLITPEDLYKKTKVKEGKMIIFDLRDKSDFSLGHIETSINLPSNSVNEQSVAGAGADKTSDIIILNQGGDVYSAAKKVNELAAKGYSNSAYLQGGIDSWKNRGYVLVSSGGGEMDGSKVKKISPDQVIDDLNIDASAIQFIDIRNMDSFSKSHIANAANIPFSSLETSQNKISTVRKVVVYGDGDEESSKAAVTLFDLNFFNAYALEGGIEKWQQVGGKIESGK